MKSGLNCECCKKELIADMCNNVWCTNRKCILYNKSYCYYFIKDRADCIKNKIDPPTKELAGFVYGQRDYQKK